MNMQHFVMPLRAEKAHPLTNMPWAIKDKDGRTVALCTYQKDAAALVLSCNAIGFAHSASEGIIKLQANSIVELGAIIDGLLLLLSEHHTYSRVKKDFCPVCANDTRANEAKLAIEHLKVTPAQLSPNCSVK